MPGAKRTRNVALILAAASLFIWCRCSAESCVESSGTKHDAWSKCTVLSEAIGALKTSTPAKPTLGEAPTDGKTVFVRTLHTLCSALSPHKGTAQSPAAESTASEEGKKVLPTRKKKGSLASKWLGAFNSTAADEVPVDDGGRTANGKLYSLEGWQSTIKSEYLVKGCATMKAIGERTTQDGYYVDKHCGDDSDTKYIGGHQCYTNELNTSLGEEVEAELGSGRRRRRRRRRRTKSRAPPKEVGKDAEEVAWTEGKTEQDGETWTKCKRAVFIGATKKSVSCKHGLYGKRCLPDEGYVLQKRAYQCRRSCTSCKPGYGFAIRFHKSRTGECIKYKSEAAIRGAVLNTDNPSIGPGEQKTVRTKIVQVMDSFKIHSVKDKGAKKHFAKATGRYGLVTVMCDLRKETICVKGNRDAKKEDVCSVEKEVVCNSVCKYTDKFAKWFNHQHHGPSFRKKNCYPNLCKGEYGRLACTGVGAMG